MCLHFFFFKHCFRCLSCTFRALSAFHSSSRLWDWNFMFVVAGGAATVMFCSQVCRLRKHKADHRTTGEGNKRTCLPCRPNWLFHIFPHCLNTEHLFSTSLWTGKAQVTSMDALLGGSCEKIITDCDIIVLCVHICRSVDQNQKVELEHFPAFMCCLFLFQLFFLKKGK